MLAQLDKRLLWIMAAIFVGIAAIMFIAFMYFDAFEVLYALTRKQAHWNLDELVVAAIATMIGGSTALIMLVYTLAQRLVKSVEEKLDVERQLAHGHQLIALGTMLGGIAHSVNNQLAPIITLTDMVKSALPAQSDLRQDLDKVLASARSAADMVNQLKAFARQDAGFIEHCKIAIATWKAIRLAQTVLPTTIELVTDIQPIEQEVALSGVALEIVLLNLVNNAVDAIEGQQGHISIWLHRCDPPKNRLLGAPVVRDDVDWVHLSVEDSGKGMTDEEQQRMFQPFYTSKVVDKGTGLGLSETYGLVRKAGGTFDVTTALGRGTLVTVYLPLQPTLNRPGTPDGMLHQSDTQSNHAAEKTI